MVLAALGAAVVNAPFEGAMLLFLFSLSNVLQAYAIDRTRKAIKSLMKLRPDKALVRRDGGIELVPVGELAVGDVLVVRPGESIALDSVIIEGTSAIDQSSLTGESMPVSKKGGRSGLCGHDQSDRRARGARCQAGEGFHDRKAGAHGRRSTDREGRDPALSRSRRAVLCRRRDSLHDRV